MKVKCINGHIEEPYKIKGKAVCTATHPQMPNNSGHSRGRKIHLQKTETMTICNMLIDGFIPSSSQNWSVVTNGKCKVCFK